jgi:hypothetical protein
MGIRGLGGFIKYKLPCARKTVRWTDHAGEAWGVDCSCLLYRARGASLSTITVLASLIVRMRRAGITPIFVFDGRTPAVKADTVASRRVVRQTAQKEMAELRVELDGDVSVRDRADMEQRCAVLQKKAPTLTSGDRDEVKQFLYAAGVLFVTATEEADDVLAYLCREDAIQCVVSTDMDMLARGVPTLVIPETTDASVLTRIALTDVLTGLGLQYPQFVNACMLMGSDYSARSWHSVDPREAVLMARRSDFAWPLVDVSGAVCSTMEAGANILMGVGVTWDAILSPKQRAKYEAGLPAPEPANVAIVAAANAWPTDWIATLAAH